MRLTIHRGTHEIGGNCIEITTAESRIILDTGLPLFDQSRQQYDTGVLRKLASAELQELGILPNVPGLFTDGPTVDAILLSHAHEDHTGLIGHSKAEIPVYASTGTSKMMLAGAKFAGQPSLPRQRFRKLRSGEPVRIGCFTVTAHSVDHSVYGSQAFLIEAGGRTILYSGDLRLHGRKPGMHRCLIDAIKGKHLDVLLMEGTQIGHLDQCGPTEYELEDDAVDHMESASGLVLASFSPLHVDRLVGFYRATVRAGRTFVVDAYSAFVMHLLASEIPIPRPESSEHIRIFFPKFFEKNYKRKRLEEFFSLMSPARIVIEKIRENPSKFVMLFRPSMLKVDFEGTLPSETRCLYSRWSGYLSQPEWQEVDSALRETMGDMVELHTSGHIFADDTETLLRQLNARSVVPIHTFEPERFRTMSENAIVLNDGETLTLA